MLCKEGKLTCLNKISLFSFDNYFSLINVTVIEIEKALKIFFYINLKKKTSFYLHFTT